MRHIIFLIGILTLSHGFAEEKIEDKSAEIYIECGNRLSHARKLAQQIENEDVRRSLIARIEACQECLRDGLQQQNYTKFNSRVENLNENLGELLGDCNQNDLREELSHSVAQLSEQFDE